MVAAAAAVATAAGPRPGPHEGAWEQGDAGVGLVLVVLSVRPDGCRTRLEVAGTALWMGQRGGVLCCWPDHGESSTGKGGERKNPRRGRYSFVRGRRHFRVRARGSGCRRWKRRAPGTCPMRPMLRDGGGQPWVQSGWVGLGWGVGCGCGCEESERPGEARRRELGPWSLEHGALSAAERASSMLLHSDGSWTSMLQAARTTTKRGEEGGVGHLYAPLQGGGVCVRGMPSSLSGEEEGGAQNGRSLRGGQPYRQPARET